MSDAAPSRAPNPIVIAKEFKYVLVIEDDFGFSVVAAITYSIFGKLGIEALGKIIQDKTIDRTTPDINLEYDDALLLAMKLEKAILIQRGEYVDPTKKKKT